MDGGTRRSDGHAGKPANVSCAGGPPLTPCVVPCHPVGTVSDGVGSFPTWHVNTPTAQALGRSPVNCPTGQPAGDDAGAPSRLESDWMHRSRASWVSLGLELGRTGAASLQTSTSPSVGAATTRGLRLRLHYLASPPASPPPLGRGGDGCAPPHSVSFPAGAMSSLSHRALGRYESWPSHFERLAGMSRSPSHFERWPV